MTSWKLDFTYAPGSFRLQSNLSWNAHVTGLIGPSGCGKSTLLEILLGLRRGAKGTVICNDVVLSDSEKGISIATADRGLAWVPQSKGLFPHFTVRQNIAYARGGSDQDGSELSKLAQTFGLESLLARYPAQLSGGEGQRVALARALYTKSKIMLLDEPLSSLDAPLKAHVLKYIRALVSGYGISLLYVTHDISELSGWADQMLQISNGTIQTIPKSATLIR